MSVYIKNITNNMSIGVGRVSLKPGHGHKFSNGMASLSSVIENELAGNLSIDWENWSEDAKVSSLPDNAYDMNIYQVRVVKIYDGDTLTAEVDLGFRTTITQVFRLEGLNTPEVRGSERKDGLVARDFVRDQVARAKKVMVRTRKTGKYGRYIATVFLDGVNLNELLIKEGMAERREY